MNHSSCQPYLRTLLEYPENALNHKSCGISVIPWRHVLACLWMDLARYVCRQKIFPKRCLCGASRIGILYNARKCSYMQFKPKAIISPQAFILKLNLCSFRGEEASPLKIGSWQWGIAPCCTDLYKCTRPKAKKTRSQTLVLASSYTSHGLEVEMQIDGPRDSMLSKGICQETRFDQDCIFSNSRFTISPLRGWVHLFLPKLRLDKPNATARLMERCKSSEGCHSWNVV